MTTPPAQGPSPTARSRWRSAGLRAAAVIGLLVALVAVSYAAKYGASPNRPAAQPNAQADAPDVTFSSAAPAAPGEIAPGVWIVGTDIQPGTYRTRGAGDGGYCMWSRHNTLAGGPMDGIIASDGALSPGTLLVTIEPTDKVFRTAGCAPFTKVS